MKTNLPVRSNSLILFGLLILVLLLAACGGGGSSNAEPTLPPQEAEDIESQAAEASELYSSFSDSTDGETLFVTYCAKCHGLDGLGAGPATGSLSVQEGMNLTLLGDRSDEDIMQILIEGKNIEMPAWGLIMTLEQRQAVLEYVRSLGQ